MEQEFTNQDLIARPCHARDHTAGSEGEFGPQLVNQLIEAAQSQHHNQRRHLSKDWQRGIRGPKIVNNQILSKAILSIPINVEECALSDAPAHAHSAVFPQSPVPANQVSLVSSLNR